MNRWTIEKLNPESSWLLRERKKKITDWKDTRIDLAVPSKGDLATVSSSDYLLMALPFVLLDFFLTYFLNIITILVLWFLFDARDRMENRVNISISPSDLGIVSRNWVGIWNAGGCSVARSADFPPPHGDCGCGRQRLQLGTSPVARKRFLPVTAGCCLAATWRLPFTQRWNQPRDPSYLLTYFFVSLLIFFFF